MSDVFGGNVAMQVGFEGLRQAFIEPTMTVREVTHEFTGRPVTLVDVVETSDAGYPQGKTFVFELFRDGQVIIMEDLDEDLSEVIQSVKEHVRWESGVRAFPFPADWVLDDEEEEADMQRIRDSAETGEGWYSPEDRGYTHS